MKVRIGTLVSELIEHCGGVSENVGKIILGGPMMGVAVSKTDIPVIKGTSGVLLMDSKRQSEFPTAVRRSQDSLWHIVFRLTFRSSK
ncbi:MAG: hypothetical protein AUJ18_10380 [Candidatus Hydrogenedentes bacterium CG1_02_42_14]|nr:MAG: hypothetical protein AUJ18_10380 [Candidatus Hydrogenedentes bacterium CG1_02_42_14]